MGKDNDQWGENHDPPSRHENEGKHQTLGLKHLQGNAPHLASLVRFS